MTWIKVISEILLVENDFVWVRVYQYKRVNRLSSSLLLEFFINMYNLSMYRFC